MFKIFLALATILTTLPAFSHPNRETYTFQLEPGTKFKLIGNVNIPPHFNQSIAYPDFANIALGLKPSQIRDLCYESGECYFQVADIQGYDRELEQGTVLTLKDFKGSRAQLVTERGTSVVIYCHHVGLEFGRWLDALSGVLVVESFPAPQKIH